MNTIPSFNTSLRTLIASLLLALAAGTGGVQADDTEVFFPDAADSEDDFLQKPNLLFMLDTSGSMACFAGSGTCPDTDPQPRIDRLKSALVQVIDDLNPNVNVGLGRFSGSNGAAILFPVAPIDAKLSDIIGDRLIVDSFSGLGAGSEAEEAGVANSVTLSSSLSPVNIRLGTAIASTTFTTTATGDFDTAELWANGTTFETGAGGTPNSNNRRCRVSDSNSAVQGTLEITNNQINYSNNKGCGSTTGTPGRLVTGLRFTNVNIPKDAVISAATLTFYVQTRPNNSSVKQVNYRIVGDDVDNSAPFGSSSTALNANQITGRTLTSAVVTGSIPSGTNPSAGNALTLTANLAPIVTEIITRTGWNTNNPITLLVGDNGTTVETGAQRIFHSALSGGASLAPQLSVTYTSAANSRLLTGVRFENVQIPRGATVREAYVEFRANGAQSPSATVAIRGERAGSDTPPFIALPTNLSARSKTAASVSWSLPGSVADKDTVLSPDIKTILSEITADASWCGGNSMALFFETTGGTGLFNAHSRFGSSPTDAPILHLILDATDAALTSGCNNARGNAQVVGGNNDGEQATSGSNSGTVNLGDGDLEFPFDGSVSQLIGLRFSDVRVPQGAVIQEAFLEFTATGASSGAFSVNIFGENSDNAPALASSASSLSNRFGNRTSASVVYSGTADAADNWVNLETYATPDLRTIVSSVVNRAGWSAGNDMVFFVQPGSASGTRRAFSANGRASAAPRLRIRYQGGAIALTVRDELKRLVLDLPASGSTPSVDALMESAYYLTGKTAFYGRTRGAGTGPGTSGASNIHRISNVKTFTAASDQTPFREGGCRDFTPSAPDCVTERWDGATTYKSPITQECASNNVVLFTDGEPTVNNASTQVKTFMGKTSSFTCKTHSAPNTSAGSCARDLAEFMRLNDQNTALTGAQTVNTFTVGMGLPASSGETRWLQEISADGGGQAKQADSATDLVNAFTDIINSVLDVNTTFVAPAVTVNTFNRLTNRDELYFALFQPFPQTKWEGNLKRYQLAGSPPRIVDATGAAAVDSATGFFKDTARSVWTPSSVTDGRLVNKGGVIERLTNTRNVYTYTGADKTPSAAVSAFDLSTERLHEDNTAVTSALLALPITGDATVDAAERAELIQWARGIDVDDDNGDSSRTDARRSLGDPLHAEPLLITYRGGDLNNDGIVDSAATPDITLYYADNEGVFHAINPVNGDELFAYVPKELIRNFNTFRGNTVGFRQRPYGLDGPITRFHNDLNGDLVPLNVNGTVQSTGGVNEAVYLYLGMRRGGRNYYSLDVTQRSNPKLRWTIYGGSGDYAELGQSWSRAVVTKIKFNGALRDVLIFSGGYDPAQDGRTTVQSDGMGRAVYIADALTGQRLWWASSQAGADLSLSTMTYSTPASPKVIDMNGDGIADRIYMSDAGGQIFRINLNAVNTGASTLANGSRIAVLSDANLASASRTTANARRFFASPDIALIKDKVAEPFLSIAIGSGFREKPNNQTIQDRFYVLRDPDEQVGENTTLNIVESDLFDATNNVIGQGTEAEAAVARTALETKKGFYIKLVDSANNFKGEKVITDSLTFNNQVIFTSFQPGVSQSACAAVLGLSRLYFINIIDGTPVAELSNNTPPDPPKCGGATVCEKEDRVLNLKQQGLPPDPTLLFTEQNPNEATLCVAAECFDLGLTVETTKTYWLKKSE